MRNEKQTRIEKEPMKLPFEEASAEIIIFSATDVIATSDRPFDDDPHQGEWDSGM